MSEPSQAPPFSCDYMISLGVCRQTPPHRIAMGPHPKSVSGSFEPDTNEGGHAHLQTSGPHRNRWRAFYSQSMATIKHGVPEVMSRHGHVAEWHQTRHHSVDGRHTGADSERGRCRRCESSARSCDQAPSEPSPNVSRTDLRRPHNPRTKPQRQQR